jgi:hypothetical protein
LGRPRVFFVGGASGLSFFTKNELKAVTSAGLYVPLLLLRLAFGGAPIGRPTWTPAGAAADAIAQMMLQCDWVPPTVEKRAKVTAQQ